MVLYFIKFATLMKASSGNGQNTINWLYVQRVKGEDLMVTDFIEEHNGYHHLAPEEML